MATLISALERQARKPLLEDTASFWSSSELVEHFNNGIKDMWGAIIDLHQEHYMVVDEEHVTIAANGKQLIGVPQNTFRILLIEPRDTTSTGTTRDIVFVPRDYNSPEFISARSWSGQSASSPAWVYYAMSQAGAPVNAPTVHVAPTFSSAVNLRFVYIPTQPIVSAGSDNPIPGESDNALIAWCVAYARAKEREDRSPDPNWLAIYATEKQNLLVRMTPRQEQEEEVVSDMFEGLW